MTIAALPGYPEEIGRWLWGMEDVRRTLLDLVRGLKPEELDRKLEGQASTVGSLLYHIALIEADWLYAEVLESEPGPEIETWFPASHRDAEGRLSPVGGESFEQHSERLSAVRKDFLEHFRSIGPEDWRRPRTLPDYDVTPEWVVYHLIEHEAHHRGQIAQMVKQLRS
ncbi:DinB family protein [Saccharibacillus sp. O23]|uniref:DinB family protein n=1 Tax=Saccharibacillus sp. O23 TaxID=2009338 RepID=UPI00211B2B8C|nr:DinB family protein [Saccharibacillus sp. O23]